MQDSTLTPILKSEDSLFESKSFSVTEITTLIRKTLESMCARVCVTGEISGYKVAQSGHAYFNLKDESSIIACVCWNSSLKRINLDLQDGASVVVRGDVTVYAGQSKYQINVLSILPVGEGRLMQMFQEMKLKLTQEGLFDNVHKKPIPFWPNVIGVITSPKGAVFWDIVHRVSDRFPTCVVLYPVPVQGPTAADEITKAIEVFNDKNRMGDLFPDVIIVARGGGSIEDLWCFNEEKVVRAVFSSDVPIVSAVGHETDFTLADFVADLRAPTPTAAAELVVPVALELKKLLWSYFCRLKNFVDKYFDQNARLLKAHSIAALQLKRIIYGKEQRLDDLELKMHSYDLRFYRNMLLKNSVRKDALLSLLTNKSLVYENVIQRLYSLAKQGLVSRLNKLDLCSVRLEKSDVRALLSRGFVLVKSENRFIYSAKTLVKDDSVELEFHDGCVSAQIKGLSYR